MKIPGCAPNTGNVASAAGPPSPEKPCEPVPANVLMLLLAASTFRILCAPWSTISTADGNHHAGRGGGAAIPAAHRGSTSCDRRDDSRGRDLAHALRPSGPFNCACAAGPLSSPKPAVPIPANVVITPLVSAF